MGVSSKIRDKKQGGGSYEVTIQDIITERIYWRQFKTKSNFDRYFTILFEVDKNLRGGGVYTFDFGLILDRYYLRSLDNKNLT